MTYQEAYEYFESFSNLTRVYRGKNHWQNSPTIIKSMHQMLRIAGNPELKIPHYVHVTGTSGKGSVSMMVSNILRVQGFKVGLITSPHPSVLRERWQINNVSMSEAEFAQIITELKPVWDTYVNTVKYTFPAMMNLNTFIAFYYFAKNHVDYAVMEVACGGKNDGTNVIPHKDVAIITNIGLDHVSILGDTKEKIALNKVGIITKKSSVVTAESDPKILKIISKAAKDKKASSYEEVASSRYSDNKGVIVKQDWKGTDFKIDNEIYHINNLGYHQIDNARIAIATAKKLGIKEAVIKKGLAETEFPIRFEVVSEEPYVILDGAHNADKVRATASSIKNLSKKYKKLHLLIGFSDNKDHGAFLKELLDLKPVSLACTRFTKNVFRKTANPRQLMTSALKINNKLKVASFLDPQAAINWSKEQLGKDDLLVITGSMFLSGELRPLFKKIK
jgi:dihydrofolate synthase/folylpolyglutamate synthase